MDSLWINVWITESNSLNKGKTQATYRGEFILRIKDKTNDGKTINLTRHYEDLNLLQKFNNNNSDVPKKLSLKAKFTVFKPTVSIPYPNPELPAKIKLYNISLLKLKMVYLQYFLYF